MCNTPHGGLHSNTEMNVELNSAGIRYHNENLVTESFIKKAKCMLGILCEDEQRDGCKGIRTAMGIAAMFKMFDIKGWRLPRCL